MAGRTALARSGIVAGRLKAGMASKSMPQEHSRRYIGAATATESTSSGRCATARANASGRENREGSAKCSSAMGTTSASPAAMAHSCASQTAVCVAVIAMPRAIAGHSAAALANDASPSATSLRADASVRGVTPASTRADSGGASGRSFCCCPEAASPTALPSSMVTCGCGAISASAAVAASAGTAAACSAAAACARRRSLRSRLVARPPGFAPV